MEAVPPTSVEAAAVPAVAPMTEPAAASGDPSSLSKRISVLIAGAARVTPKSQEAVLEAPPSLDATLSSRATSLLLFFLSPSTSTVSAPTDAPPDSPVAEDPAVASVAMAAAPRKALPQRLSAGAPLLPKSAGSPTPLATAPPHRAASMIVPLALVLIALAIAPFARAAITSLPSPPPACHWEWSAGCIPSNAHTTSCEFQLSKAVGSDGWCHAK